MQKVAPDVYIESGYYGVTVGAIITGDGVICVDSPMLPADARDWKSRLAGLTSQPVRYVIYTDAHRDRVLGSQYLGLGDDEGLRRCLSPADG
jgi:glyoxylase-like metal-dependent hydrolase (beta-lactamase superfamily II)